MIAKVLHLGINTTEGTSSSELLAPRLFMPPILSFIFSIYPFPLSLSLSLSFPNPLTIYQVFLCPQWISGASVVRSSIIQEETNFTRGLSRDLLLIFSCGTLLTHSFFRITGIWLVLRRRTKLVQTEP